MPRFVHQAERHVGRDIEPRRRCELIIGDNGELIIDDNVDEAVGTDVGFGEEFDQPEQAAVLRTLVGAQVLSGAGLSAGVTVGALLARDLLGSDGLAGVPVALFAIGSAGASVLVGRVSDRSGRRRGLAMGYTAGAVGALCVVLAAHMGSIVLLLPALFVYGAGTATNLQARYAGADLASPLNRGRAVSTVLVATTVGAMIGPNALSPMGALAEHVGLPRLAGPFMLACAAYGAAAVVLTVRLRPDPLLLARRRAAVAAGAGTVENVAPTSRTVSETVSEAVADARTDPGPVGLSRAVVLGGAVMVTAQLVMVAVMTMTPVHLEHSGHGLSATGFVIGAHVAGMYLPSPLTGRVVDRFGSGPVAVASGVALALAGILAAVVPGTSIIWMTVALVTLGLGWNLGLLSGTAIVAAAAPLASRARAQGAVDLSVALAAAGAGLGSGPVLAASTFGTLSMVAALVALTSVGVVGLSTMRRTNGGVERWHASR